jgi:hypothetical protein
MLSTDSIMTASAFAPMMTMRAVAIQWRARACGVLNDSARGIEPLAVPPRPDEAAFQEEVLYAR